MRHAKARGALNIYRLQCTKIIQNRKYRPGVFDKRIKLISFNLISLLSSVVLGMYLFHSIFVFDEVSVSLIFLQLAMMVLVDDFYFYWFHRLLHNVPYSYKKIHKIHHRAYAPIPMDYIYVHPLEMWGGAVGTVLGIVLCYLCFGEISAYAFWAFSTIRNLHEVDIHSGLHSKMGNYIPFLGLTEHHDRHHMKATKGNYASMLTFWDVMLGTQVTK